MGLPLSHSAAHPYRQHVTLFTAERPLCLESGQTLAPVRVAYETYGLLSPAADNAVLVCHALTGDAHAAAHAADDAEGWWEPAVGPGKPLDTDRYFVVCSNVLGGCQGTTGPASTNPATGRPYGLDFPVVTVRDMVRVQAALLEHLGVRRIKTVIGGSVGAMQALEWAILYPDRLQSTIPIAGGGRFHPQGIAYNEVQRQAIINDPHFCGGQYYGRPQQPAQGLAIARMLGMITYRSDESMWQQFGRDVQGETELLPPDRFGYQVESYLHHQGEKLVRRFDANSYLYLSRAMDMHNIARGRESYAAAYALVRAPALVIGIRSDILFPTYQQREMAEMLTRHGAGAQYLEMDSPWGHDAFLVDFHLIADAIRSFLGNI